MEAASQTLFVGRLPAGFLLEGPSVRSVTEALSREPMASTPLLLCLPEGARVSRVPPSLEGALRTL